MTGVDAKTPAMVAKSLSEEIGVKKATGSWWRIFILGMLAGAFIGFGAELSTMVTCDLAKYTGVGFAKFMAGSVFSVGLILVVIAGAELFTGNNLMIMSSLSKKISWGRLLGRWGWVYLANFVGSMVLVWVMYGSGLWKVGNFAVGAKALSIANAKVNLSWVEAFCRGIGCNWLVCLAVWMALSSRNVIGKIFAIYFPIMAFVASGFEHSIANMYFIPLGIYLKGQSAVVTAANLTGKLNNLTWRGFWISNEIPVTLGNIVGGAFFVGFIYWLTYYYRSKKSEVK
ncbi:formate/nitrite transporter family protein [Candidatus Aerophobetes bacterium]|uniref:Formate/nitrite transporter family protein n=1 Tax=Aerophobetes bacterium TaxID=2030807 RepID=A0A662D1X8_UNCAE|nr:MAG: formate/nitrite transporter family protein [Candidatus Aerophobetes bacterium]